MKLLPETAGGLLLLAALALTGCGSDTPAETASVGDLAGLAPAAAPVAKTGDHLVRFDLVGGESNRMIGTFARQEGIAVPHGYDSVWAGPHPETGELVLWAGSASAGGVVLLTAGPPGLKMNVSTDTYTVFAGDLGAAGNFRLQRGVFR